MGVIRHLTLGRYQPGDSFVHRLDPRIKLAGLPLYIVATFSSRHPSQLLFLTAVAALLAALCRQPPGLWWRGLWIFRWLFLFTVMLHLLLSPGRTLFGVGWLSLDGLIQGGCIAWQLALAVVFSSLLSLTTSPAELAGALSSLFGPLRRVGLPVDRAVEMMLLVLHFIPILRQEAAAQFDEAGADQRLRSGALEGRVRAVGGLVRPLLLRLVDRAEDLAQAQAAGRPVFEEPAALEPIWRLAPAALAVVLAGAGGLVLVWGTMA